MKAEIVEKYRDISPALILYFDNHIQMPVRPYRFDEYLELLELNGVKVKCK